MRKIKLIKQFIIYLLNKGYNDKYECSDCHKINYLPKYSLHDVTVGFCWNCGHPIWEKL